MNAHLSQAKKFWSDMFFGPDRAILPIESQHYFKESISEIRQWLEELLCIPSAAWRLDYCAKNPHSEIFIFSQSFDLKIIKKIFIKKYIIQLKGSSKIGVEELLQEVNFLSKLKNITHENCKIFTPTLLGINQDKYLIATSYEDGSSFFNVLFESPFTHLLNVNKEPSHLSSLYALGSWLRTVHDNLIKDFNPTSSTESIQDSLNSDIQPRLYHLRKARPADFTPDLCRRILAVTSDACKQIDLNQHSFVSIHGDFTLANILYDAEKLCVLDFANSTCGHRESDIARMYLDLYNIEKYTFLFSPRKKKLYHSSFLDGYGAKFDFHYDPIWRIYLIKHAVINIFMYAKHWGNSSFLNPFYCRLFYSFQRKFLMNLINN